MPPFDDNTQALTSVASSSGSCSLPPSSSMTNVCDAVAIPSNEEISGVPKNELIAPEDKNVPDLIEDATATSVAEKDSEENEQQEVREQVMTTQEAEVDQNGAATAEAKEETNEEGAEVHNDSSKVPESQNSTQRNTDDDIEWLSPFSLPRVKEDEDGDEKPAESEERNDDTEIKGKDALKMLKKGAVAAVGGTMVGMGLVMIPLPTPFGAVVASSGLAVLGTEFDEAKELNEKLIDGTKAHLNKARDAVVKGIEKMNEDETDVDTSATSNNKTLDSDGTPGQKKQPGEAGAVIKINASASFDDIGGKPSEDSENSESGNSSESPPVWLHMNEIERNRQAKLAKEKYRKEHQTSYEQAKEAFTKRTGKFLSKNLLPYIKKTEPSSTVDIDTSTAVAKSDETSNNISATEKGENSESKDDQIDAKSKSNEEQLCDSQTIETNDNDSEGYVVVS